MDDSTSVLNPQKKWTFRNYFTVIGMIIALLALFGTDPDAGLIKLPFGADVIAKLSTLPAAVFGVFLLYVGTKALYDYINMGKVVEKACEDPKGAGLVAVAVALSRIAVAIVIIGIIDVFR